MNFIQKIIIAGLLSVVLIGAMSILIKYKVITLPIPTKQAAQPSDYKAVFLSNDQIFFGRLKGEKEQFVVLEDALYLRQNNTNPQTTALNLIKRGNEIHGPSRMLINRDHILYIEDVGPDSKFSQAIPQAQPLTNTLGATTQASSVPAGFPAPTQTPKTSKTIRINESEVGFLRVRSNPTIDAQEVGKVNPDSIFTVLEETEGWYKIEYEPGKQGWVAASYATLITQ